MGLIRKSLAVGTIGVVNGSSKKQRVARAQINELRAIRQAVAPERVLTQADYQSIEAARREQALAAAAAKGQDTRPFWER